MKPTLNKLNDDSDFDVRYFASEAATGTFQLSSFQRAEILKQRVLVLYLVSYYLANIVSIRATRNSETTKCYQGSASSLCSYAVM